MYCSVMVLRLLITHYPTPVRFNSGEPTNHIRAWMKRPFYTRWPDWVLVPEWLIPSWQPFRPRGKSIWLHSHFNLNKHTLNELNLALSAGPGRKTVSQNDTEQDTENKRRACLSVIYWHSSWFFLILCFPYLRSGFLSGHWPPDEQVIHLKWS